LLVNAKAAREGGMFRFSSKEVERHSSQKMKDLLRYQKSLLGLSQRCRSTPKGTG
jgi:hypothetical protein